MTSAPTLSSSVNSEVVLIFLSLYLKVNEKEANVHLMMAIFEIEAAVVCLYLRLC